MVTQNPNFVEVDGEILPHYGPGHGNEPKYPAHHREEMPHDFDGISGVAVAQVVKPPVVIPHTYGNEGRSPAAADALRRSDADYMEAQRRALGRR